MPVSNYLQFFVKFVKSVDYNVVMTLYFKRWIGRCIEIHMFMYTGRNRRNGPDFGTVFPRSYYTDITQNTYIQSSMVTEVLAREV